MTWPNPAESLVLRADDLCSKWGFNDGDEPEWLWDYCQEHGLDWSALDWRIVLRRLVGAYLLPALSKHHKLEVYELDTHHNPIRAARIDGHDIDDCAGRRAAPPLTPAEVRVPADVVISEVHAALPTTDS